VDPKNPVHQRAAKNMHHLVATPNDLKHLEPG
jgi:hypothetical protein